MIKIKSIKIEDKDYDVYEHDAKLIKQIRDKFGLIQAIRVFRWLTGCRLTTAKDFVEGL